MTVSRRAVIQYVVPADLVIIASGIGLMHRESPLLFVVAFVAAAGVSTWMGGWRGGLTAMGLSVLAGGYAGGSHYDATQIVATLFASAAAAAIIRAGTMTAPALSVALVPGGSPAFWPPFIGTISPERLARKYEEPQQPEPPAPEEPEAEPETPAGRVASERVERARQLDALKRAAQARAERIEAARRAEALRAAREARALREAEQERERAKQLEEEKRIAEEKLEAEKRLVAENAERLEQEKRAAEELLEKRLAEERAQFEKELAERIAAERKNAQPQAQPQPQPQPQVAKPAPSGGGIFQSVAHWFDKKPAAPKKFAKPISKPRPVSASTATAPRRRRVDEPKPPRLLLLEKRRATADIIVPRAKQRGVEIEVVERLVDVVNALDRFRPDALFIDCELPDFEKCYRTLANQSDGMPIFISGRSAGTIVQDAPVVLRPYDIDDIVGIAKDPRGSMKALRKTKTKEAPPVPPQQQALMQAFYAQPAPAPQPVVSNDPIYEVTCFSCRVTFDAMEGEWCSCLAKERTIVCTNCLTCFCKAPAAYKEKFWIDAGAAIFERKAHEAVPLPMPANLPATDVSRPLVLCVEDDEEIQHVVQRVCSNLGYGFIYATNGQDGLEIAREYKPNLILSDAFMPKLDGREMCRTLKDEAAFDATMVVMTGLYTDTKYRSEALKRFRVDEYLAKPVAVTELIQLLQRYLDATPTAPVEEVIETFDVPGAGSFALADALTDEQEVAAKQTLPEVELEMEVFAEPKVTNDAYDVCCFHCSHVFDATRADWCRCVGRDNTLVCSECGGCFCKAPAAYRERFWMDAPPSLFERKMLGSKRHVSHLGNPLPSEVTRPLILLVEDDENVQLIVKTVVTTMGYGFVAGANGQEGLTLAREYKPDLILSDAFMPKLDGREMCRLLKQDPVMGSMKAIIMTGLYTDRKYRNEALDYFRVDDYVAKPLAVDDLIKLFKKHLAQEVEQTM